MFIFLSFRDCSKFLVHLEFILNTVKVPSHYLYVFSLIGGAAEQAGTIEAGDEILAINGKPLVGLMHFDAWNIMKSVPEGPVQLLIRKHRNSS